MKKLLYLLVAIFFLVSCETEKKELQYSVTVSVDTLIDGYAYLQKREDGEWVRLDSAVMSNGSVNLQGVVDYPVMYYIYINDLKRTVPIFLDEGNIQVSVFKDDYAATSITGSSAQDQYQVFQDEIKTYNNQLREIYKIYRLAKDSGTTEEIDSLSLLIDDIYETQQQFIKEFVCL